MMGGLGVGVAAPTTNGDIRATGTINAASHSVGTSWIANTSGVYMTLPLTANGSTGTAGQLLYSNGATGSPYWGAAASSYTISTGLVNTSGTVTVNTAYIATLAAASATFLNSSHYIARTGSSGNANTDFQNTPAGTKRFQGDDANVTGGPANAWWFYENLRHSNGSGYWGTQIAWGWEDNANKLATRNIQNGTFGSWYYYLNNGNYASYVSQLTSLGVGVAASGTTGRFSLSEALHFTTANPYIQTNNGSGQSYFHAPGGAYFNSGTVYCEAQIRARGGIGNDTAASLQIYGGTSSLTQVNGTLNCTGDVVSAYSDMRLKTVTGKIENALDKVYSIEGFYYKPNKTAIDLGVDKYDNQRVGVSAQAIQKILPEAVKTVKNEEKDYEYLTVQYERIVPLLIEAIKELKEEIEILKGNK
jgi:hypothetical protein